MRYTLCTALLVLVTGIFIFGQQPAITISGKITDEQGNPLPSVTVRLLKNGAGTATNRLGFFRLSFPENQDTLLISSIGYASKKIAVAELLHGKINLVQLAGRTEVLQQVTVKPVDPLAIVQSAIDKIPDNYLNIPHISHGFYRIGTKKGEEHLMLSEAVFDILNHGYSSVKGNSFKLIKSRYIQDEDGVHGIDLGVKPKGLYSADMIKNIGESEFLSKKGLKKHRFKLLKTIQYNNADTYVIGFDQRDDIKESLYTGKLYIDAESLAFVFIEYSRSEKGIPYARYGDAATKALLKIMGIDIDIKGESHTLLYQPVNGKWFLSGRKEIHLWNFKSNRRFYDFPARIQLDYLVTGIDTLNVSSFEAKETLGNNKMIEFQNAGVQTDFWKDYNIILPDYNSDSIAKNIIAKNESHDLRKQVEKKLKGFPKEESVRIDSILSFYHRNGAFNGSVLIKKESKVLLSKGYGWADREQNIPASGTTQYRIGSVTKTFTSLLILQLVAENRLSLSDTIGKYLPAFVHQQITIQQLLTHTSGIPSYTSDIDKMVSVMSREQTLQEIITTLCSGALEFTSGSQFRYSNSGYTILAGIIEAVTGKAYGQVLKEKIFDPLLMHQTSFGTNPANSKGYWLGSAEPVYVIKNIAGAGGISSTVTDLLKWDEALNTGQLIPQTLLNEAFIPRAAYDDWDAGYGLGWMIDKKMFRQSKAHKIIYHPGTDIGYYAMFVRQPDTGNLIIMLSNYGEFPRFDLADLILDEIN